jgi:nucleoside-diphosphate-sugar epimerase
MKCVIIGAGGFIGRHLARAGLARSGPARSGDVLALDVAPPPDSSDAGFEIEACDAVAGDIALPRGVDVVYYLAQSPFYRDFPAHGDHLFAVNVVGALRAAAAAEEAGARLFCYASSGTIYEPGFEPMAEDRPARRDHAYALSKVCAEEALSLRGGATGVLCVRLFGVFGPGQGATLVQGVIDRVRGGRPVTIEPHPHDPADTGGLRISLTYVEDVAGCLLALGERAVAGRATAPVLNVAGPAPVAIRQLAEQVGREAGVAPTFERAERCRESDYVADIGRLRGHIDPRFTSLDEALARTLMAHV